MSSIFPLSYLAMLCSIILDIYLTLKVWQKDNTMSLDGTVLDEHVFYRIMKFFFPSTRYCMENLVY